MFRKVMGLAALAAASVGTAQASWEARGNGLVYDTVLDITILTDFNYAQTSGYDADGRMNFSGATSWADQLTYSSISDWRLASISELSYIFNTDLGTQVGTPTTNTAGDTSEQIANLSKVSNLQTFDYYSSTSYPCCGYVWGYYTGGLNNNNARAIDTSYELYTVAVASGDVAVAAVPEPETWALCLLALGTLTAVRQPRRRGPTAAG